jgi:phenylpyruvate tautomerase PptA (4-oxalocrotonate tautomerase family)
MQECQLSDVEAPSSIAVVPNPCSGGPAASPSENDLNALVKAVTDSVMQALGK